MFGVIMPVPLTLASFLRQLPSPNFAPMGSSVHLDVTHLPHLISYLLFNYFFFPLFVPCNFLPLLLTPPPSNIQGWFTCCSSLQSMLLL